MRFVLLVEGHAENMAASSFLKRWLDPQLTEPVGVKPVNFKGNATLVRKIVTRAQDYLDGPDAPEIIAVIGLLDLYGLDIYPPKLTTVKERHDWAVKDIERQVDRPKFRMCFAVHEFEAWILSQPDIFPRPIQDALPKNVAQPEKVNFDEPPAKLLNRLYRSRTHKNYKKTTYGKTLFGKLDPTVAAGKCPYLKDMLAKMLKLAKAAGR
ncbi:hypothetical protein LCGC14_2844600 [marine sediment metagenome]|uniref:DUF4276 family protein n=1 Tax=marine sediment metagenome TaxID=412755 RepID=A0A0F9B192_9ZZZZ